MIHQRTFGHTYTIDSVFSHSWCWLLLRDSLLYVKIHIASLGTTRWADLNRMHIISKWVKQRSALIHSYVYKYM